MSKCDVTGLSILNQTDLDQIIESHDKDFIVGLNFSDQRDVVESIANELYTKTFEGKKKTSEDISIELTDLINSNITDYKEDIKDLETLITFEDKEIYRHNIKSITEQIHRQEAVLENLDNLILLSKEALNTLDGIQVINSDTTIVKEKLDVEDTESEAGLERTSFSDSFSLELDSMNTASGRLRKYLAFIPEVEFVSGEPVVKENFIGKTKYLGFNAAYVELHRILVGLPANQQLILSKLKDIAKQALDTENASLAWLDNFIEYYKSFPYHIQKEFISDITKHKVDMKFVMYDVRKDKSGATHFMLRMHDDNSTSTAARLLKVWKREHENSFILVDGVYDKEVVKQLSEKLNTIRTDLKSPEQSLEKSNAVYNILTSLGILVNKSYLDSIFINGNPLFIRGERATAQSIISRDGVLDRLLKNIPTGNTLENTNFMNDSIIRGFAQGSSLFENDEFSNSFRVGDKTIHTFSNNQYFVNRITELINNPTLREDLNNTLFAQDSLYLQLLNTNELKFRDWFNYGYVSLHPLKRNKGKRSDKLTKTSPIDHELAKVGHFQSGRAYELMTVKTQTGNRTVQVRKAEYFAPTNADKSRIMSVKGIAIDSVIKRVKTTNGKQTITPDYSEESLDIFLDTVIQPEITRIHKSSLEGFKERINLSSYNGGLFYLIPELNNFKIKEYVGEEVVNEKLLVDFAAESEILPNEVRAALKIKLRNILIKKSLQKVTKWKDIGLIEDNKLVHIEAIEDSNGNTRNIYETAMDMVYNNMLANTNIFQLIVGDVAQYYKSKSTDLVQQALDSYDNIGKRLAAEIAPGMEFEGEDYLQVFANDVIEESVSLEYYKKLYGDNPEVVEDYKKMEGTDAQEYTTWREHLNILRDMGRLTLEEYKEAHDAFAESKLPKKSIFSKVLQPLKPVYVNNIIENVGESKVDKKIYIKSSSFPLIPALTKGLEIDNLRIALEGLETKVKGKKLGVRFAYKTAVKVGFPLQKNAVTLRDENNQFKTDFSLNELNYKVLPRKGFRIQQDIPYDSKKDTINKGSQEAKLLWTNTQDKYKNEQTRYLELYEKLYLHGLDKLVNKISSPNGTTSLEKVAKLLRSELKSRGETSKPLMDGLNIITTKYESEGKIVKTKAFALPLWMSPYADKYMSLLSSIVKKNVVSQKLPGKSFVLGSNQGIKPKLVEGKEGIEYINKTSGIVFTDSYNPKKGLQGVRKENGKIMPAQVLMPFKFKDTQGNILDVNKFLIKENNKTYIDYNKLPKDILKSFGFRIPTQLHSSMSYMEIVGFLPTISGDLIIAPSEFTIQMGSDFDVDKLYTYLYRARYNSETQTLTKITEKQNYPQELQLSDKIISLSEVALKDEAKTKKLKIDIKLLTNQVKDIIEESDIQLQAKDIVNLLDIAGISDTLVKKYIESVLNREEVESSYLAGIHNSILDIHLDILSKPDVELQKSVAAPLGFGEYIKKDGTGFVDKIKNLEEDKLSIDSIIDDEYQKTKFFDGTAGKDGISVFSSDSIFNALAQGKDITLTTQKITQEGFPITIPVQVVFGNKYEVSHGDLSAVRTLKKENPRLKTEVIAAAQNLSVDNANEQGMFKINMNTETFGVYSLLNFLGFEEDISAPFMSQPIIKEFVEKMNNNKSILNPYNPYFEEELVQELIKKYSKGAYISNKHVKHADFQGKDASQTLMNLIRDGESHGEFGLYQASILEKFYNLKQHERPISNVKKLLNKDSKGFDKNMYINKRTWNSVLNLESSRLVNADTLLGKYQTVLDTSGNKVKIIEPTTLAGYDHVYGTKSLIEYFQNFFLESIPGYKFEDIINNITDVIKPGKELAEKSIYEIRESYKTFLMSSFKDIKNIDTYRAKLIFDKSEDSLFKDLQKLRNTRYGKNNIFLNSLEVTFTNFLEVNYNNAGGDNFDESALYLNFVDLFRQTTPINGVIPAKIAEDLTLYGILRGGNKANQFLKFIPNSVLQKVLIIPQEGDINTNTFIDQWVRHNPEKLIEFEEIDTKILKELKPSGGKFVRLNKNEVQTTSAGPEYILIKDEVYKHVVDTKYHKVNKLGFEGISEYNTKDKYKSIFKNNNKVEASVLEKLFVKEIKPVEVTQGTQVEQQKYNADNNPVIVNNFADSLDWTSAKNLVASIVSLEGVEYAYYKELAKVVMDKLSDSVTIKKGGTGSWFNPNLNEIVISDKKLKAKDKTELLNVILHEALHAITVQTITSFDKGIEIDQDSKDAIIRLTGFKNRLIENMDVNQQQQLQVVLGSYFAKDFEKRRVIAGRLLNNAYTPKIVKNVVQRIVEHHNNPFDDIDGTEEAFVQSLREYSPVQSDRFYYGFLNLQEFIAVSTTSPELVKMYESLSGGTYISTIKEFFQHILKALGIVDSPVIESMFADTFTIAEVPKIKPSIKTKLKLDSAKENNLVVTYNNEEYFMDKNNIYNVKTPDVVKYANNTPQRYSFINNYVQSLVSNAGLMHTSGELLDDWIRPFKEDGIEYSSILAAIETMQTLDVGKIRYESFIQNPVLAAKFLQSESKDTKLREQLQNYFGLSAEKQVVKIEKKEKVVGYNRGNLPKLQGTPTKLVGKSATIDQNKANYATKMIGFGEEGSDIAKNKEEFDSPFLDLNELMELETKGEEIREDCQTSSKPKVKKGLRASLKNRGSWEVVKDLRGLPSHKNGGIDLTINAKGGVNFSNGKVAYKAEYGLYRPYKGGEYSWQATNDYTDLPQAENGMYIKKGKPKKKEQKAEALKTPKQSSNISWSILDNNNYKRYAKCGAKIPVKKK